MKPIVINRDLVAWLVSGAVYGNVHRYKSVRMQALCCEIIEQNQVDLIAAGLMTLPKVTSANKKIAAYRVRDGEWFDDSDEVGLGMKLLKVLQLYEKENLMLILCMWDDGMPMKHGFEIFGCVMKCAAELIAKCDAIAAAEQLKPAKMYRNVSKRTIEFQGRSAYHYQPSSVIIQTKVDRFRPFSLDRYYTAVAQLDQTLQVIRPADMHELLNSKSYMEVMITCDCFCTLLGRKNPSWNDFKSIITSPSIVADLRKLDLRTIRPELVRQVASILTAHPEVTVEKLLRMSRAAATILKWCESVVVIYIGLKDIEKAELDQKLTLALKGQNQHQQETIEVAELRVRKVQQRKKNQRYDPVMELLADMEKTMWGQMSEKALDLTTTFEDRKNATTAPTEALHSSQHHRVKSAPAGLVVRMSNRNL